MDNRYLFQAKIKENNNTGYKELDWIIGNLVVEQSTGRHFIIDLSHFDENTKMCDVMIEVDPSTICQCTGLKDKNGKLIWENDVVVTQYGKAVIVWDASRWRIKWVDELIWRRDLHYWANDNDFGVEVIGNKFDNPELLGCRNDRE